jgi:hydroxymethylpyrimidine pyrophosphatase-like HAD family hydrolase
MPETRTTFRTTHAKYDLVISDIDGCLGPETTAPLNAEVLARIAAHNRLAAQRRDRPLVTVCSGRPQPFAEAMCRLIANDLMPCVAENGVWLWDPRTCDYEMDPAIGPDHRRAVREASAWAEETYGPRGVVQQPGKAASMSLYHPDAAYLRSLQPAIAGEFARRGWPLRVSMTWFYINCDLAHVSKGTGIDRLVRMMGLDKSRLAGIGDTPSDLAIADRVGAFCCPLNADESIKPRAAYVAKSPEAEGVLEILEHLTGER